MSTSSTDTKAIIIENFIDYYTSNNHERRAMKAVAADYMRDDHVNEIDDFIASNPLTPEL